MLALTSGTGAVHGAKPPARDCCCPSRSSGHPGDGWGGHAGGRRGSAALRVPLPASHLAFSHTLSLLLYLSLIIRPALRNPRLPLWQLLRIYPAVPEKRWLPSQPADGQGRDEGCPRPRDLPCSQRWARPWCPHDPGAAAGSREEPSAKQSHSSFSLPSAPRSDRGFGRAQTGAEADVELQKSAPCGEAMVVGSRAGVDRDAGTPSLPGPVQAESLPSSRSRRREPARGCVWGLASTMVLTGVRRPPAELTRRVLSDSRPVLYPELDSCPQLIAGREEGGMPALTEWLLARF